MIGEAERKMKQNETATVEYLRVPGLDKILREIRRCPCGYKELVLRLNETCPKCGRKIALHFPEKLAKLVSIFETGKFVIIRAKQPLHMLEFAQISGIVHAYCGEFVSIGKYSHFRIPKT